MAGTAERVIRGCVIAAGALFLLLVASITLAFLVCRSNPPPTSTSAAASRAPGIGDAFRVGNFTYRIRSVRLANRVNLPKETRDAGPDDVFCVIDYTETSLSHRPYRAVSPTPFVNVRVNNWNVGWMEFDDLPSFEFQPATTYEGTIAFALSRELATGPAAVEVRPRLLQGEAPPPQRYAAPVRLPFTFPERPVTEARVRPPWPRSNP